MNDGLKDEHRQAVLDILRGHPGVEKVVLFGSRAMGTFTAESDVDICLYGDSLTRTDQAKLAARIAELPVPQRVDLLLHCAIEDKALLAHIQREGTVLFECGGVKVGEWIERSLGELTDNFDGIRKPVKETDRRPGRYPYYGASGVIDRVDDFIFDGEYLLIAEDGENLRTRSTPIAFLARGKFWVNNHAHIVRGNSEADTRFLMYAMSAANISGYLTGSTMPKLTQGNMNRIPLLAPPLAEQRAIAHILGTLDDKIELNRRMNKTLEAMAQALFKSWFVDFAPVRAKAEGRDPGLPRHSADLFPDSFEDSELGEIPKGWQAGSLGCVAEHPRRGIQPKEIVPGTPYIALEHMPRRCIALSDWETADGLESNKFEFRRGEILFGKLRPYFHKVGVAPVDGVCSTDIVVLAPRGMPWSGFVLGHASSDAFVEYTNAGSTGTKMPRTGWTDMERYRIVIPPAGVAEAFTNRVWPSVERIVAGVHESRSLATLRDTLLPKLISGELRVNDAERIVKEVTV